MQAQEFTFEDDEDYRIPHRAPMHDSGSPLYDLTDTYPDDIYGPNGVQYYGTREPWDARSIRVIQLSRNKPNQTIQIFRAVPKEVKSNTINPGDWVTASKEYATQHGKGLGKYKLLSKIVPAKTLFTNGDSIHEWGYDPGGAAQPVAEGSVDPTQQDLTDVADWMNTTSDKIKVVVKQEPIEKFLQQIREMYSTYDEFPKDAKRTNRIVSLLKKGEKPLPIYVEANDPYLFAMEGRHRMVAFWLAGMKTIPVAYVYRQNDKKQGVAEDKMISNGQPVENITVYHGGKQPITKFNIPPYGVFFTPHKDWAEQYGTVVTAAKIQSPNVYIVSSDGKGFDNEVLDALFRRDYASLTKIIKLLMSRGYTALQTQTDTEMLCVFPGTNIQIVDSSDDPVAENFADGKGPGRPGDSVRHGIPKKATMAELEKASRSAGRKGQLARWQLNMRRGKAKGRNESVAESADDEIHNYKKLDHILATLCELVVQGQQHDPEKYGMVAACVLDPDNQVATGINLPAGNGKRRHAERVAIDKYHKEYGKIPPGSIILTTCSPCSEHMDERYGEDCTQLINSSGVKKVYCGFNDPTQPEQHREFNCMETANGQIRTLCSKFAEQFLDMESKNQVSEAVVKKSNLKTYAARVRLKQLGYTNIVDATVSARNPEMARRLLHQLYGGNSSVVGQPREIK